MSNFTTTKPFIVMTYGFPGSGKTAFARQLAEELGIIHVQEDKVRADLFGDQADDHSVRKIMNYMAHEFLSNNVSVVYDTDVLRTSERKIVRDLAHSAKAAPLLVWLQVDPETSFIRTQKRDRRKSDDKFAKEYTEDSFRTILSGMQNPTREDYIVISGKHTFHSQRAAVTKKLYDLGVITPDVIRQNVAKPELMNYVPQQNRGEVPRRNISIRWAQTTQLSLMVEFSSMLPNDVVWNLYAWE